MTVLRAIVVDDEPLAREGLATELRALGVDVVAECADGFAAVDATLRQKPDLLLLDVAMPELDGFGVLERLEPEETPPAVVFVTAFDAHALRAFDARALDYLLKPVAKDRLGAAVARAARRVDEWRAHRAVLAADGAPPLPNETHSSYLAQLLVRERDGVVVVPVDSLEWIEADAYYVRLHPLGGGRPRLLRERMRVLDARLDPAIFHRTHRSAIVRLDCVRAVRSLSRYESVAVLASGAEAPVSRERRESLEARLGGGGRR